MSIEELQQQLLELQETIKTLQGDNENLKKVNEESTKRTKELEEYNQKLFLRATATQKEDKPKEENFTSKLLGDYAKLLSDDEIELLKEIEEDL